MPIALQADETAEQRTEGNASEPDQVDIHIGAVFARTPRKDNRASSAAPHRARCARPGPPSAVLGAPRLRAARGAYVAGGRNRTPSAPPSTPPPAPSATIATSIKPHASAPARVPC